MTTPKKKHRLKRIRLRELSLVDRGANPRARITLLKRDSGDAHQENDDMEIRKIGDVEVASFDSAVDAIAAAERVPRHRAMSIAAQRFPTLLEKFQAEGEHIVAKAAEAARPKPISKAELAFQDKVDDIVKRDRIGRAEAMSEARRRHPDEFAAAYSDTVT